MYNLYFNINLLNQKISIDNSENNNNCDKDNNLKNIFYNNLLKRIPFLTNLKIIKVYDKLNHLFNKDIIIFSYNVVWIGLAFNLDIMYKSNIFKITEHGIWECNLKNE